MKSRWTKPGAAGKQRRDGSGSQIHSIRAPGFTIGWK